MSPFIKVFAGAVLLGVGFVVSMQGQRELKAHWACKDCDDEITLEEAHDLIDIHAKDPEEEEVE